MFMRSKRLMYTVRVSEQNPALATLVLEQFGGPQHGLAAAMRYFAQAMAEGNPDRRDMLRDIAADELARLEAIGSIVCMLGKSMRGTLADRMRDGEQMADIAKGGESHILSQLNGDSALVKSAGVPWAAIDVDNLTKRAVGLRSGIAAEARARMHYERLINATDDPSLRDALGFLMTRGMAHRASLEKVLHAIERSLSRGSARPSGRSAMPQSDDENSRISGR